MTNKYDIYMEDVKSLLMEGKTVTDISRIINVDSRRISELVKKLGMTSKKFSEAKEILIPTEQQIQFLIGGIMGDMCIFKDKNNKHYRMNCAHSLKQKSYLLYKYEILKNMFNPPAYRNWIDKRTNKKYEEVRIQTITHPFFSNLYNTWYKNGKKIVSEDLFKLNAEGLSIWYMDDGCKKISHKKYKTYSLSTNAFNNKDLEIVQDVLLENFNIKVTIQKSSNIVYVRSESTMNFLNLIYPYVIDDMVYKL